MALGHQVISQKQAPCTALPYHSQYLPVWSVLIKDEWKQNCFVHINDLMIHLIWRSMKIWRLTPKVHKGTWTKPAKSARTDATTEPSRWIEAEQVHRYAKPKTEVPITSRFYYWFYYTVYITFSTKFLSHERFLSPVAIIRPQWKWAWTQAPEFWNTQESSFIQKWHQGQHGSTPSSQLFSAHAPA